MERSPLDLLEQTLRGGENGGASREPCCACRRRGERKHLSHEGLRIVDDTKREGKKGGQARFAEKIIRKFSICMTKQLGCGHTSLSP